MANNVVAFIGIDNFDNIIYLSRILTKLGKRVLILDHSETMSIRHSIPQPKGLNCDKEIITYRQVDFATIDFKENMKKEYDDILIYCGFHALEKNIAHCNRLVYVTDLYRYNYIRMPKPSMVYGNDKPFELGLLIKEATPIKITPEIISENIGIPFSPENISVLYHDEKDYANSLICQYNGSYIFSKISKQRKSYLMEEVRKLHP